MNKPKALETPKGLFVKWGSLEDESDEKNILQWLYKDVDSESIPQYHQSTLPSTQYGQGFLIL